LSGFVEARGDFGFALVEAFVALFERLHAPFELRFAVA
jgi:hypothetical protein